MDLMGGFHPVFLLLVWLQAAAGHVEPPTNVILHCHNRRNVLEWSYEQLSTPGLKFRVNIRSYLNSSPRELWVNSTTTTLQADVSFLSDPNDEYHLTVTAVIGLNESNSAPPNGITFSYFKGSQTDQKCFLDFPTVNVSAQQDGNVLFRFTHPSLLYHQQQPDSPNPKLRKKKSHDAHISTHLPVFYYEVVIINQKEQLHSLDCVESVCEDKVPVDAAQEKHCLKVTGELQKMSLKGTQEYCALPLEEAPLEQNNYIYVVVVSLLALCAVAFVLFMVYRKKTKPSTSIPNSMTFTSRLKQKWTFRVVQEPVFVPEVEPTSPTPLLSEGKEFTPTVTPSTEVDIRLPIGVPTEDEGVSDVVEVGNDEGPGYMQGRNLEEDETLSTGEIPSGYEKRPVLVELAPDEKTEGYRG